MQPRDTTSTIDPLGLGGTILATIAALLILVAYTSLLLGWWKPIEAERATERVRASNPFADFEPFVTRRPAYAAHHSYTSVSTRSARHAASPLTPNSEFPSPRLPAAASSPSSAPEPHTASILDVESSILPSAVDGPDYPARDDPRDDVSTVLSLSSTVPPSYRPSRPTYSNKPLVPPMPGVAGPAVAGSTSDPKLLPVSYPPSSFSQNHGGRPVSSRPRGYTRPRGERPRKSQDGGVRLAGGPLGAVVSEPQENPFEESRSLVRTPSTRPPSYCTLEVSHASAPALNSLEKNESRVG
ncbi:hypothetical protein C8Q73DRAFT_672989 [Cubamyces lactineus]|nr:hypothetical protein C8Q73DRAFT_672989 [Cubamyces lactineus]